MAIYIAYRYDRLDAVTKLKIWDDVTTQYVLYDVLDQELTNADSPEEVWASAFQAMHTKWVRMGGKPWLATWDPIEGPTVVYQRTSVDRSPQEVWEGEVVSVTYPDQKAITDGRST